MLKQITKTNILNPKDRIKELHSQIDELEKEIDNLNKTYEVGDVVRIEQSNIGSYSGKVGVVIEIIESYDYPYRVWISEHLKLWCKVKSY